MEGLLLPVIPLVVLDRGGDASMVGVVALAYAVPSLLARPVIGRFIDRHGFTGVQTLGGVGFALFPLGYLLPGLGVMVLTRLCQGISWSLYGTANNVLLAVLAPESRRAELTGYVSACRAAAFLVGPLVGLWLFAKSPAAAVVATSALGVVAAVLSSTWRRMSRTARRAPAPPHKAQGLARFVETRSLTPMVMVSMFMASQSLFLYFAPVFVQERGLDLAVLAAFYPTYGVVLTVGPILFGRMSDRVGRELVITLGCGLVIVGLGVAALPSPGFSLFMAGAVIAGLTSSMVTAAIGAAVIDRADATRIGSAMATYSMGFQLAAGVGGLLWGALISAFGFPMPFLAAIALQGATIVLARYWRRGTAPT